MIDKKYLLFLAILIILPGIALFARPSMIGVDSYAFINGICHKDAFPSTPILAKAVFEALPCDLTVLKALAWVLYACLVGVIAYLGNKFFGKDGLIAPVFAFLSLYWLLFPWELENDLLAMPFLWATFILFYNNKKLEALLLTLFVGATLWGGAWLYLFAFWNYGPSLLIGIITLALNFNTIIGTLLPNAIVAENMILGGFISIFALNIGWFGFKDKELRKKFLPQLVFFAGIVLISGKYAYHAIPLLCLGCVGLWKSLNPVGKNCLIAAALVMFFLISANIYSTYPKEGTLESVQYGIELAEKQQKQLLNDWDIGYYLEFYSYDTNFKGGIPNPDYNKARNAIIISQLDLNFPIKKEFGSYRIFEVD